MLEDILNKPIPDLSNLRKRKGEYKKWPIHECNERMVAANKHFRCKSYYWNYNPRPDGAMEAVYVRKGVLDKLLAINEGLRPHRLQLLVQEGYRPLSVQQFVRERSVYNALVKEHPGKTDTEIKAMISEFAASPEQECPPHLSGGAVDVKLVTLEGFDVEMGKVKGLFKTAHPDSFEGEGHWAHMVARNNRRLLYHLALEQGMVTNPSEWWHISYGDQMWAWMMGQTHAIYGPTLVF